MEKLKLHTPDLTAQNIDKLAQLFPNCVTETRDEQGHVTQAIDFDQLRQELSGSIVEGPRERYHLDWPGKREAILAANAPVAKTLRPCRAESVDFDTTKNLFIEGDNLDALKLLQETYLGKVKLIYIDPPYNTGNDFIYEDDFAEDSNSYLLRSNQKDEAGGRMVANTDSNGRFHSDWLSMMYPRLRLSRNLLSEDGIVMISCDDCEAVNLRKLLDEVFGEQNFIANFIWKARQFTDARATTNVSTDHEYILVYARSDDFAMRGIGRDESKFANPDNDPRGPWMSRSILGLATKEQRPNLHYDFVDPQTQSAFPPNPATGWRYSKERMENLIADGRILFPKSRDGRPREKKFRMDMKDDFIAFRSIIEDVFTADGTQEIRDILGADVFPYPKPSSLIEKFIEQATGEEDIILDFFAGSGTTAHATMQRNLIANSKRRYILVQLPEPLDSENRNQRMAADFCSNIGKPRNISSITKERIRRVGQRLRSESLLTAPNLDTGFRVLKIDTSNMRDVYYAPDAVAQGDLLAQVDNIRQDRTPEDLLFQVLVDQGVDLALPIAEETITGKKVFFVDGNALAACFDFGITDDLVKEIAKRKPLRAVFRDSSYGSDSVKINVDQIFRLLSPDTEVKSI
jgi:adenine-specific DNA-methyltransferase